MAEPAPVPIERLLAESTWLARMARGLVADPHLADDVAQTTWLTALRSPPREGRGVRGWLATVARRAAGRLRRESGRREARERAAAHRDVVAAPDPAELTARVELQERVARAVLSLDEPYRATVISRYFEDRSAAEIARSLGIPAATVRTRLRRALGMLRERLDRESGGRERWMPVLVALLPGSGPVPAVAGARLVLAVVVLLVLACPFVALLASRDSTAPAEPPPRASVEVASASPAPVLPPVPPATPEGTPARPTEDLEPVAPAAPAAPGRPVAERPESPPPAPAEEPTPAGPGHTTVRGLVESEDVVPLPGIGIRVSRVGRGATICSGRTDAAGRFLLAIPPVEGEADLIVAGDGGYVPTVLPLREVLAARGREIRIVLRRGFTIEGRVVNDAGAPVETVLQAGRIEPDGARRRSPSRDDPSRPCTLAHTDVRGRFVVRGLVPGRYHLEVASQNYLAGEGSTAECDAGTVGVEIVAYRAVCLKVSFVGSSPSTEPPRPRSAASRPAPGVSG